MCCFIVKNTTGVAVWGQPGDPPLLSCGPCVPQKGPLRTAQLPPEHSSSCRGLDGLLQTALLQQKSSSQKGRTIMLNRCSVQCSLSSPLLYALVSQSTVRQSPVMSTAALYCGKRCVGFRCLLHHYSSGYYLSAYCMMKHHLAGSGLRMSVHVWEVLHASKVL